MRVGSGRFVFLLRRVSALGLIAGFTDSNMIKPNFLFKQLNRVAAVLVLIFVHLAVIGGLAAPRSAFASESVKITMLGDSLTAGYGLSGSEAFPSKLEAALRAAGHSVSITNAGVSGDTTTQALARLDWALSDNPDAVFVQLGGNDALRGQDPALARKNMKSIVEKLQAKNIKVMMFGMLAPPNMGEDYARDFNSIFPDVAKQYDVPLYPFFLDGAITNADLMQADAIHPNTKGVDVIVERAMPSVVEFLETLND